MSETQVLVKTVNDDEDDTNEHEASAAQAADNDDDEDLEDGEIDDDDDDENNGTKSRAAVAQGADQNNENVNKINSLSSSFDEKTQNKQHDSTTKSATDIITIDLAYENSSSPTPVTAASSSSSLMKSKKTYHIEDDHASSIEIALANVLKKKGIDPIMPKVLESRSGQQDAKDKDVEIVVGQGQSRSSRRRKRKKQRDDKDKDRKEKKRNRYDSPEPSGGAPPLDDEDDMDDYEMLNVRGGSPPPITATSAAVAHSAYGAYKDSYDSAADSCSSYDSYESQGDTGGAGDGGSRRRRRGKKDRKRRSGRNRDDDRNRLEKRTRRDSGDDKHRQEPRKLELCKFYLMECCAKKEKCSYMHKDFPCKYYYLGMECVLNDACKFSHGEPLSEQLRNILLKHLETAPKEILGNFKRISRENAISLVTKRHEELCKKFSVDNTWSTIINLPMNHNRNIGGGGGAGGDHHNLQQLQQLQQQAQQVQMQQLQQQQMQQQQQNQMHSNIPSLLDMVINPPIVGVASNTVNSKADKQRKSRWADTSSGNCCVEPSPCNGAGTSAAAAAAALTQPPPPSYLDLKNLTGILSAEHIDKLSQLGIVNLEQVDKLTFGQLNQIGLTIAEISEIQLNAINMAKLGVTGAQAESGASGKQKVADNSNPTNRDVDMRFLPSVPATTATTITTTATTTTTSKVTSDATTNSLNAEKDNIVSSNSSSNSSNPVVTVDYTQYLKDSNISFDRNDAYDDEKDEEQLVIDDYNTDDEENAAAASSVESTAKKEEKQRSDSFSNELPSRLRIPDIVNTLKNPFNTLYAPSLTMNESKKEKEKENLNRGTRDPRSFMADFQRRNPFKAYKDDSADESNHNNSDEDYDSRYQLPSLARSDRSRSRTPSQSSTPEASQSPEPQESGSVQVIYDRKTMYDFSARQAEEDELKRAAKSIKADKDMRFLQGAGGGVGSDIDLRLPFQPVTNYTPATEIDGSITSHLPMTYKVYVVDVLAASYTELRKTFKSDQTTDPRLRRILGLPELSQTKTSAALSRTVRKLSNSIASPSESEGASPKYYTPPSSISDDRKSSAVTTAAQPRMDPRRAAAAAAATITSTSSNNSSTSSSGAIKQNVEIRNLLQKSDWYKNLNSKFKIMVNQQLAIVSTELKKFHQDDSSNKIFDITFIVTNSTLQQILTHLGIFINDNGEVEHVDPDSDEPQITSNSLGIALPNLSQPPPQQQQMNFLRAPPPNLAPPHLFRQGSGPPPSMNMTQFGPPPNSRPSLLGLPPGAAQGNPFNPFAGNMPDMGVGMNPNFVGGTGGGPGLIGAGPINFGNFGLGMPPNMQQRNFNLGGGGGNQQRGHRNQNRRNNFNGGGGNIL